ncbi:MAG TPA: oligosaccharide flippase family protein [Gemmatimonadales bacterium]|nr:oligosaccharide flippase family protein [Gemmatimonadales bacterium]
MPTDPPIRAPDASSDRARVLWSNSVAQLIGVVCARLSRAAGILLMARALGPDGFGQLATGLAGYEMLRVIGEAGLDTRLIRLAAQDPGGAQLAARQTIWLKFRLYAVATLAGALLAFSTGGRNGTALLGALSVGLVGVALTGSSQAIATARLDARGLIPYQAVAGLVFFVVVTALARLIGTPVAGAIAVGLGDTAAGAIMFAYTRIPLPPWRTSVSSQADWTALKEAIPIGAIGILGTAYARLGVAALAIFWGTVAVAQYGVSYRVVEIFLLASSAVSGSAYAVTSRIDSNEGVEGTRLLLNDVLKRVAPPTLLISTVVVAGAPLLPILFGASYAPAVATTRVLAWALPVMFVNGLLTAHLYGRGRFRTVLGIAVLNLVVNGAALTVFLQISGPPGAAMAVVCTECGNTFLQSRAAGLGPKSWSIWVAGISLIAGFAMFGIAIHA